MSVLGERVKAKGDRTTNPTVPLDPWFQTDYERSVCLVALAARADSRSTGLFCKFGSEMCILTTQLLIPSEPVACFATAEFFITGSCRAQHTVKLNPQVTFELLEGDGCKMTIVGMPKTLRPAFEDGEHRGRMKELPPMQLCTDQALYPYVGEHCDLVGHPFGAAKGKYVLTVSKVDEKEGLMFFKEPAPDGCHGAPILFQGQCVAILDQPKMGPRANTARLMHTILPESYSEGGDLETKSPEKGRSPKKKKYKWDGPGPSLARIDYELKQIQDMQAEEEYTKSMGPSQEEVAELTRAVQQGNLEALLLLQHRLGLDVLRSWSDFNGRTAVHFAAFYSNPISLAGLRRQGYNLHGKTETGDTAVHIACYQGSLDCLKLLHGWGCSLVIANKNGDRPSHKAAIRGRVDILAYLANNGVDVSSVKNDQSLTPIDLAQESGTWETVQLLEAAERPPSRAQRVAEDGRDKSTCDALIDMHVPEFYKVPEDWPPHMAPGPGTAENHDIRTRESTRGDQERGGGENDLKGNKGLYLRAKTREDSKRAERKILQEGKGGRREGEVGGRGEEEHDELE